MKRLYSRALRVTVWTGLVVWGLLAWGAEPAEPLLGALALINELRKIDAEAVASPAVPSAEDEVSKLQEDLKQFQSGWTNLAPAKAAAEWLTLWDRFWAIAPQKLQRPARSSHFRRDSEKQLTASSLVEAIPGPQSWPELSTLVEQRPAGPTPSRERSLRLLAYFLSGQTDKMKAEIDKGETEASKLKEEYLRKNAIQSFNQLRFYLLKMAETDEPGQLAVQLDQLLDFQKKVQSANLTICLPDLVGLADRKVISESEPRRLIEKALATPEVSLAVPAGGKTLSLAQQITLSTIDQLLVPQWQLVSSLDAVPLYEALTNRFPEEPAEEREHMIDPLQLDSTLVRGGYYRGSKEQRKLARQYYLAGLLAQNRTNEASEILLTIDEFHYFSSWEQPWKLLEQTLPMENLLSFFEALLLRNPDNELLWNQFFNPALSVGRVEPALKLIEQALAHEGIKPGMKRKLLQRQLAAYLALDQLDRAVPLLRALSATNDLPKEGREQETFHQDRLENAVKFMQIAKLLEQPALLEEVSQTVMEATLNYAEQTEHGGYYSDESLRKTCDELGARKQFARAENFVRQLAAIFIRQAAGTRPSYDLSEQLRAILIHLAKIYNRAGRFQDTVTLLDQAPWWGAEDLLDINLRGNSDLAVVAAEALAAVGRNEEADKILKTHLTQHSGDDAAYRVLVARGNDGLIPWLDQLYARDRFEERPLIWKAWLQLKAGQLTNAEATIRLALKVDPTDGEQKAGDRVYAYTVLADVLSVQDKTNEAALFRNVVAAVRLAEKGDEFTEAGLIKRSLPFYEQAEKLFKDAYCVQWRLAARLAALGDSAGAERHYALAFTHMPLQFGQVASFCFGCEGAFDTQLRRNAAEDVILKQTTAEPKRPQVCYLLGQLREAQMRYAEAYQYYQQALKIDPDYLDVWEKIYGMKETIPLTSRQSDELLLKMLQLDPLQRHSCSQLNRIYQLRELWRVLAQNQKYAVERPESLLVLTAAKEQLEKKEKATREFKISGDGYYDYYAYQERSMVPTPGEALAQQEFIVAILNLMQMQPADY